MAPGKVSLASPCARCPATLGRSCCETGPGERLATLTASDVARIRAATGWRRERFVEEEPLAPDEAVAYEARRPGWAGYFARSGVRWTLRTSEGACVLLGPAGCVLDAEARPTACRLYPFEPAVHGWTLAVERSGSPDAARASGEPRCLAVEEASGRGALLRAFGTDEAALVHLATRLRAEVRAHPDPLVD